MWVVDLFLMMNNHFFHLVSLSPWPFIMSLNLINVGLGGMLFIISGESWGLIFILVLITILYQWWRDIIRESVFGGLHSAGAIKGLSLGMMGFIVSELFFFVSFFWMYFYLSLSPDLSLGFNWPPLGFMAVSFLDIPFLNTLILLSSGFFVTWSHYSLSLNKGGIFYVSLLSGIFLGFYFMIIQALEYYNMTFDISGGGYSSSFYILTGFHGFHVLLGFLFLTINLFRFGFNHFSWATYSGFEYSVWYWHFVDVIWLFLYLFIYWWGG